MEAIVHYERSLFPSRTQKHHLGNHSPGRILCLNDTQERFFLGEDKEYALTPETDLRLPSIFEKDVEWECCALAISMTSSMELLCFSRSFALYALEIADETTEDAAACTTPDTIPPVNTPINSAVDMVTTLCMRKFLS